MSTKPQVEGCVEQDRTQCPLKDLRMVSGLTPLLTLMVDYQGEHNDPIVIPQLSFHH